MVWHSFGPGLSGRPCGRHSCAWTLTQRTHGHAWRVCRFVKKTYLAWAMHGVQLYGAVHTVELESTIRKAWSALEPSSGTEGTLSGHALHFKLYFARTRFPFILAGLMCLVRLAAGV